jgi:TatA/E family protein of Tat protein translocase
MIAPWPPDHPIAGAFAMDLFAPKHLILVLLVVLLVFGTKKLKTLGSDLGSAFRGFKKAMNDGEGEEQSKQLAPVAKDAEFPDVAAAKPAPAQPHPESKTAPHA